MMKYNFKPCFVNIKDDNEYIKAVAETVKSRNKKTFFYLNSYSYYLANKNKKFSQAFNKADYIIADGYSIVKAIKRTCKQDIKKVVFTYSFLNELGEYFDKEKVNLFLLGGTEEVIQKSKIEINKKYPSVNISGIHNGFFKKEHDTEKIISEINTSNADVLIVGMGMPFSEIWIQENLNKINVPCIFSVGGFFDFISNSKKAAPGWLYNSGLEWLFRLIQEPRRLFSRYLKANFYFLRKLYFR